MTEIQCRALNILQDQGPMTAGQLGAELWEKKRSARRFGTNADATRYCRPAGRVLAGLKKINAVSGPTCENGVTFVWRFNPDYDL